VTLRRGGLGALALVAAVFGYNLVTATSGFVTAYDTYDRLAISLAQFEYSAPEEPIAIGIAIDNPTDQTVEIRTIEVFINAGVHRVGGGTLNPGQRFAPGNQETFAIQGDINDTNYVSRLAGQPINWGISGRILVQLHRGLDPVWIPFAGSYVTEAVP
jgi:hypothetical protein